MFKSIYLRLVATYLTLFLVIVAIISFFSTSIFYKEFTNQTEDNLRNAGIKTNSLMERYYNNEITKSELTAWIDAMGYISNIKIYVLNPDASILQQVSQNDVLDINEILKQDLKNAMDGKEKIRMTSVSMVLNADDLDGSSSEEEVIYITMPLKYNNTISGVIMIFSPFTEVNKLLKEAIITIITVVVLVILIGTLAILRVSINISNPIKQISEYAKQIGKGIDVPDVVVETDDEIAMLGNSFNEMKKELLATEQMRKEIVANVSHELRTPLTSIIGFIKGILDGVISKDEEEKYLSIAYEEANRLKELTKDIVDVAKLESGNLSLNKEKFNLNELVQDVYIEFEEMVKEKNLEFVLKEKTKDIIINADKGRIRQVLINILNNSLKFTDKGSIKMSVEKVQNNIEIKVKDTGTGIQKDKISYLFNKFYTANDYGSATSGAGLGLNIVKNIVDMHNGDVKIESDLGTGTTVYVRLPLE